MNGFQEKKKSEFAQNANLRIGTKIKKKHRMENKTFRHLFVLFEIKNKQKHKIFAVKCNKCGKVFNMYGENIRRHLNSKAGGCKFCYHSSKTHGMSKHPAFKVWEGMVRRCYNKKHEQYMNYGGRGIKICKEWKNNPKSFLDWAECHNWEKGMDIDRIDNNEGYGPTNCRIVNRSDNLNNTRFNHKIFVFGESLTIAQASKKYGIKYTTIRERILHGWEGDKIVSEPRRYKNVRH